MTQNASETEVTAATATTDWVVKYTVSVTFGGKTYTAETEHISVPGTATGEPEGHNTPSRGGSRRWCGKDHSGSFWQRIVGFFHAIFYFFAHLFGLR